MSEAWAWLSGQLQTNQFFSGSALAGAIVGVLALLKIYALRAWNWLVAYFRISVEVYSEDPSYHVWVQWLKQQKFDTFRRSYRLRRGLELTPSYGTYCLWFGWHPVWLTLVRDAQPQDREKGPPKEVLTIKTFSWRRSSAWFSTVMGDLEARMAAANKSSVPIYSGNNGWTWRGSIPRAATAHVVLPAGQLEALEADIEKFYASEADYMFKGIPYRRGYLLHGLPGTGKTSLIRHLARKYAGSVLLCDIKVPVIDATKPFLIFEDVDCALTQPGREHLRVDPDAAQAEATGQGRGLLLGEMLNALDGIVAMHGAIVIMTTNHREKLDPALLRPGRIDYEIEFTHATPDQVAELTSRFFKELGPITLAVPHTTAQLQAKLQRAKNAPEAKQLLEAA